MIALMVITCGRAEYLRQTMRSAEQHLKGNITKRFIVNDTLDIGMGAAFNDWLQDTYSGTHTIVGPTYGPNGQRKMGFSGAIQVGWETIRAYAPDCEYIFHLEEDFLFNEDIYLDEMAKVLDADPQLAQLALLRQPWNEEEKEAGGIIQLRPDTYEECVLYVKHRNFFTTNPCLYRKSLTDIGWPQRQYSEGHFSIMLREAGYYFGFWQESKFDEPKVTHIGVERIGTGY